MGIVSRNPAQANGLLTVQRSNATRGTGQQVEGGVLWLVEPAGGKVLMETSRR